ncbi:Stabilizer of axonemal microtubules 2 [Trichoplax sp. H2]|uniref:Stabilizer of axonemal microtubules 2 n=1 Tax=Trichoplax adhaerens TaxID=10228 RepID=B3RW78_TRIAD|nr:hypothetical protein TRIADDRAFT_55913 [Trichoplax adhaerens]EDV26130.1 hypothetical protein TRIADDRAFT_55913 [Trichoplax adhaerens]RDD36724.1 Stabilizer of axonemal microtubules 2 [Trichoplax sp. H2]|eukprot:XP_002112163.1 hypothetical protein TRIADDRAFT_55913 [Trichoplax adhaerens]
MATAKQIRRAYIQGGYKNSYKPTEVYRRPKNGEYLTNYREFYPSYPKAKPSTPVRPFTRERTPAIKKGPMVFETAQRSDFIPLPISKRNKASVTVFKNSEKPLLSGDMDIKTTYNETFKHNKLKYKPVTITKPEARAVTSYDNRRKFVPLTTHAEEFKPRKIDRQSCYSDPPCYTGSILYPDRHLSHFSTTTSDAFKQLPGERARRVQASKDNLAIEGDFYHNTSYKNNFTPHQLELAHIKPVEKKVMITKTKQPRHKFDAITQSKDDFKAYRDSRPPKPITPPPSTLQLFEGEKSEFITANADSYRGWDTSKHTRIPPAKIAEPDYKPPIDKFENLTTSKSHYQPIKEHENYKPVMFKPVPKAESVNRKFDYQTTQNVEFKPYLIDPKERPKNYKIIDIYNPTLEKFDSTTTTRDTYKSFAKASKASAWKPPTQDHRSHQPFIDHTEYRQSFHEKQSEPWPPTKFVQQYLQYHRGQDKSAENTN